jgi:hypothetical protein
MATPRDDKNKPAKSERSNTRTASRMMSEGGLVLSSLKGESAKNEDAKSEALREAIKKGKVAGSGSNGSVASGMARPVGNTPAPSHGSVISEPVSARAPPSGFAQPVGVGSGRSTPSALRSGASQSIGSAGPASTGASKRGSRANSAQTVNSSSHAGSARTRQRRG